MSDGMRRELAYLSSHATNRYFIPNWGKYMTDAHSSAIFKEVCHAANVPCQYFVNHSDVAGGSTLGNILTSQIDIDGVDVGNPIWAMHSAMETGSIADHEYAIQAFIEFFNTEL